MEEMNENLLDLVPVRKKRFMRHGEYIKITVPKYKKAWKRKVASAFGLPLITNITLDKRSSAAWDLINGKRDVRELGIKLKARFGDKMDPLYPRLATLLMIMEREGLISYIDPEDVPKGSAKKKTIKKKVKAVEKEEPADEPEEEKIQEVEGSEMEEASTDDEAVEPEGKD